MPGSPSADSDARDKDDAVTANKSSDGGGMTVATQGETAQVPMAQPASIARSSSPRDDGGSGSNSAKSSKTSPPPAASASDLAATTPVSASSPPSHPHDEGPAIQALAQHPEPPPRGRKQRIPERLQNKRKRGHTPPAAYSRRDGRDDGHARDRRRSRSRSRSRPLSRPHDGATREHQPGGGDRGGVDAGEPPRQRKRPGGGARVGQAALDAVRRRQEERERARYEELHRRAAATGVHDVVREHYNAIPERGREWRKTDSRIKGLRAFNNWVKSCVIQKFAPDEDFVMPPQPQQGPRYGRADYHDHHHHQQGEPPRRLLVADLGCGKGGDLGKWQQCPQPVALYVGLDPAEISIQQARDRYMDMRSRRRRGGGGGGGGGGGPHQLFHAEFFVQDCFGAWLGHIPVLQEAGIDASVGPEGNPMSARWGGGGFDVVTSMFAMHYAFETEAKARQMLHNVAGLLKKGGRFIGVGPNSDVLSENVVAWHGRQGGGEECAQQDGVEGKEVDDAAGQPAATAEWGNKIYHVRFPGKTPADGIFRPPFGWRYSYFLEEAVEEVPEYVVPWEAFRALAEEYNLELQYRKPFLDVWKEERNDPSLGPLSERMGVRGRDGGPLLVSDEELEAAGLYHAFCFYKV